MTIDAAIILLRQTAKREILVNPRKLNEAADLLENLRCGWAEHGVCPKYEKEDE